MIIPVIIAVGDKYLEMAKICLRTYIRYNSQYPLIVLVERYALSQMRELFSAPIIFRSIGGYELQAKRDVGIKEYARVAYSDLIHLREYSSLKPLIAEYAIADVYPNAQYAMTMDIDGIFTGCVMREFEDELWRHKHLPELYMVERTDPRMHHIESRHSRIGSGVTIWKRNSRFLEIFKRLYSKKHAGVGGGSQEIINTIIQGNELSGAILENPFLHFVSPDKVTDLTDDQIRKFAPAYIHLHGGQCVERMERFAKVFGI